MSATKRLLYFVWDALHYISGEGTWTLKPHELFVLQQAITYLDEHVGNSIQKQLVRPFFIERMAQGRINVIRYYEQEEQDQISNPGFSDLLVRVKFAVDGIEQIAQVQILKGYLFCIEFKKKGSFYAGCRLEARQVSIGNPKLSYARALDRLEHGRSEE